jgi:hypothetical protein
MFMTGQELREAAAVIRFEPHARHASSSRPNPASGRPAAVAGGGSRAGRRYGPRRPFPSPAAGWRGPAEPWNAEPTWQGGRQVPPRGG